ncbi:hypothetical protein VTJ49DRAFT_345 [Mycothermus thermophilus]|uniref:Uncharacterized protein n=1 Tax=Humicola insolens TaxID=85995 RepID=A0ABR3VFA1_HUMIN
MATFVTLYQGPLSQTEGGRNQVPSAEEPHSVSRAEIPVPGELSSSNRHRANGASCARFSTGGRQECSAAAHETLIRQAPQIDPIELSRPHREPHSTVCT